jgi:hypothetical protein
MTHHNTHSARPAQLDAFKYQDHMEIKSGKLRCIKPVEVHKRLNQNISLRGFWKKN